MNVGQCYFLSDPAQQFQGRWQDESEDKPGSQARAQAHRSAMIWMETSEPTDQIRLTGTDSTGWALKGPGLMNRMGG